MQAQGKWSGSCRVEVLIDECGRALQGGKGVGGLAREGLKLVKRRT